MRREDPSLDPLPILPDREGVPCIFGAEGDVVWTRAAFRKQVEAWADRLASAGPRLIFLMAPNTPDALACLYGAWSAGHAVALLDPDTTSDSFGRLSAAFDPDLVIRTSQEASGDGPGGGLSIGEGGPGPAGPAPHGVSTLLSTSGTTGSLKFVRLSTRNLVANADQIAAALGMTPADIGVAHLPIHYSYGLSVVTSHLRFGAAVHVWPGSITDPDFWASVRRSGATQFPGVPFHYNFLARGDLASLLPPALRVFTQAGGPLAPRLQSRMGEQLAAIGGRFFVMYGQTEASPRIATLPADRLTEKLGSVGPALPGGRLTILNQGGAPAPVGEAGRVVYDGPNVMLGYAENRADLALGDVMGGHLETGDLGRLDSEGFLTLTGRVKRIAKTHGLRLSLEEIEARFHAAGEVAAIERGDKVLLFTETAEPVRALLAEVSGEYKLPAATFSVREVSRLPRKPSGKIDYAALEGIA